VLAQRASPKRGPRPFTDRRLNSLQTRRERLPWPADRPFRILSLDGGGIRGVYAATLLALIESEVLEGGSVADHVEMIAGTSTGGIIGIGLTTDNAQAQATLLLGPENILRLEPTGAAAAIDLADWEGAVRQLPGLAQAHFRQHLDRISAFFSQKASPRHRFYTTIRGEI
jgi:hypothetical protein